MTAQMSQLGPVASGWNVLPLKWVAQMAAGGTPDSNDSSYWCEYSEGTPWVAIGDMSQVKYVQRTAKSLTPTGLFSRKLPIGEPGTILFAMYASVGEVAVLDTQATWNQALLGVTPGSLLDGRFLYYMLAAMKPHLVSEFRSTTQNNLNAEQVGNFRVPVPPHSQQDAIADFLDRETAKIDAVIEKQRALANGLRFRREAVLDSLDVTDFRRVKLSYLVESLPGYAFPSSGFLQGEEGVRLLRGVNVKPGWLDWTDAVSWPSDGTSALSRYKLEVDDIALGLDRPFISKGTRSVLIEEQDAGALLVQRVLRLRTGRKVLPRFAYHALNGRRFREHAETVFTGVSVPHLSEDQVLGFDIPLPSLAKQSELAAHIDRETARIDALIARSERLIELSQERRAALITAAVTGRIDITTDTDIREEAA